MSIPTVHCRVLGSRVTCITDLDGTATEVICPAFEVGRDCADFEVTDGAADGLRTPQTEDDLDVAASRTRKRCCRGRRR